MKNKKYLFWIIGICVFFVFIYMSNFTAVGAEINELLTNGLLFSLVILPYVFGFWLFAIISSICLCRSMGKGTWYWIALCFVVLAMLIVPLTFHEIANVITMQSLWFWLILTVSLIGTRLIFNSKSLFRKVYSVILTVGILLCTPTVLRDTLPYLYSPPVLTEKTIEVYNESILFLQERNSIERFRINMRNWIPFDIRKNMNEDDIKLAMEIRSKLIKVACYQLEKYGDLILFYKHGHRIFPSGPGVVYSIYGGNPNDIEDGQVNRLKPFEHIEGNWYMSRNMTFMGPRIDILTKIPKSLIDRSKLIDDVPKKALHRFDNLKIQKDPNS